MISPISDQMIAGSAVLTDLNGEEVLLLRTEMQREIYQQGRDSLSYFIFLLFSVAAIFCLIVVMLLERQILSPLAFLSQRVISIGHSGTLSERIGMTGNDEVAALAYEIDDMLDQLQQASKALTESEEKFRKLAESSVACIFILQSGHFRYVNPIAVAIFGYSREQFTQMEYQKLFMKDDRTLVQDFIHEVEMGREYAARFELRALTSNGAVRWLEITASPIEYEGERAVIGTAYDLTEHKLAEEQLRYLSNHDALSGLYNRTYFEEELNRLESGRVHPISIVIIDIDGLKPTNDTCGHAAGDELIRQTAKVLRKVFRAEDVVARIGGDEFAVLLPGVDEEEVLQVQKRIQETLVTTNEERQSGPRLQFSVGVATAKQPSSLEAVMRKADEHMYRVKLKRKQQAVDPSNCPDLDELDIRDSRRQ
jgi:diguanylate cyclase (GGDEF)-like protein/PAS domain S-box-containing protein